MTENKTTDSDAIRYRDEAAAPVSIPEATTDDAPDRPPNPGTGPK